MKERRIRGLIAIACGIGLAALALMVWSVLVPTPLPVMMAMSLGQALGTISLLLYLLAVLLDLRRAKVMLHDVELPGLSKPDLPAARDDGAAPSPGEGG